MVTLSILIPCLPLFWMGVWMWNSLPRRRGAASKIEEHCCTQRPLSISNVRVIIFANVDCKLTAKWALTSSQLIALHFLLRPSWTEQSYLVQLVGNLQLVQSSFPALQVMAIIYRINSCMMRIRCIAYL